MTRHPRCRRPIAPLVVAAVTGIAAGLLLPARPAAAGTTVLDKLPFATTFQHDRAPTKTALSVFTRFQGARNPADDTALDLWSQQLRLAIELTLPMEFERLSFFAEGGYQYSGSGDLPQGWVNLLLGAKFALIHEDDLIVSVWGQGEIPIGSESVYPVTYARLDAGLGLAIAPVETFAVNLVATAGAIVDVGTAFTSLFFPDLPDSDTLQCRLLVEAAADIPGVATFRGGIEAFYRDGGGDRAAFNLFAEASLFEYRFVFVRVTVPFDVDGNSPGIEGTWVSGDIVIHVGVTLTIHTVAVYD
jgi:hypothetical protein